MHYACFDIAKFNDILCTMIQCLITSLHGVGINLAIFQTTMSHLGSLPPLKILQTSCNKVPGTNHT